MTCTKTGAQVYLEEYNQTMPCDVYVVGDCTIFKMNMEAFDTRRSSWGNQKATHFVNIGPSGNNFWRKDLGLLVIPTNQVEVYAEE